MAISEAITDELQLRLTSRLDLSFLHFSTPRLALLSSLSACRNVRDEQRRGSACAGHRTKGVYASQQTAFSSPSHTFFLPQSLAASNLPSALKFAKKSLSLYPTDEASALVAKVEQLLSSSTSSSATQNGTSAPSASASQSASSTTEQLRNRRPQPSTSSAPKTDEPTEKRREYTASQAALVKRVKGCRTTAYYEILQLEKTCTDGEIKKAYKKVSRLLASLLRCLTRFPRTLKSACSATASRQKCRTRCR
jgi:hypothetical protein